MFSVQSPALTACRAPAETRALLLAQRGTETGAQDNTKPRKIRIAEPTEAPLAHGVKNGDEKELKPMHFAKTSNTARAEDTIKHM